MTDRGKRKKKGGSAAAAPDYAVGYGRPPVHSQFKKGQPRPPRKPRESQPARTFDDYLAEELAELMPIKENGIEQIVPKGKAMAKASVNGVIKSGDPRRLKGFLPKPRTEADLDFSETDLAMIARFLVKAVPGGIEGLIRLLSDTDDGGAGGPNAPASATDDDGEDDDRKEDDQ